MDESCSSPATFYAPAGRDAAAQVARSFDLTQHTPLLQQTIDAMSDSVVILNARRQVIAANAALLQVLDSPLKDVLGKRPGELLGCRNVAQGPDGCGTAPGCKMCGALNTVLECQSTGDRMSRECRIAVEEPIGGAFDLLVTATQVDLAGEAFTICVLKDISDSKRLSVMARMFFHDVMNTAGGIQGYVEVLREQVSQDSAEAQELAELQGLANQLVEEILGQRDLVFAESGELEPQFGPVRPGQVLERLRALYSKHPVGFRRPVELVAIWPGAIITDERLLGRVLSNMIKNALEATPPEGRVTVRCVERGSQVEFTVHNATVMPEEVQMQVFQRSFSTKGKAGRGIGTHSMKLLGERYLGGKVTFTSREPEGTVFTLILPKVRFASPVFEPRR